MTDLKRIVKSLLFAIAYGDAFGMPTEMMSCAEIKARIGYVNQFLPSQKSIYFDRQLAPGSITDDTIFSLMLIDMIIEQDGVITTSAYVNKVLDWINDDLINKNVIGPSTLKAFEAIKNGLSIEQTGIFGTTNGAAMKIAPIGLINIYNDEDHLIDDVYKICLPTHNTRVAISGAIVIAYIVYAFIKEKIDWSNIWVNIYRILDKVKHLGVDTSHALLSCRIKVVENIVTGGLNLEDKVDIIKTQIGTSMETLETVPTAIALAYLAQGDLKMCATMSANIGGDTDTIGAIACAILNAKCHTILDDELDFIENTNNINFDVLSDKLVDCLIKRKKNQWL